MPGARPPRCLQYPGGYLRRLTITPAGVFKNQTLRMRACFRRDAGKRSLHGRHRPLAADARSLCDADSGRALLALRRHSAAAIASVGDYQGRQFLRMCGRLGGGVPGLRRTGGASHASVRNHDGCQPTMTVAGRAGSGGVGSGRGVGGLDAAFCAAVAMTAPGGRCDSGRSPAAPAGPDPGCRMRRGHPVPQARGRRVRRHARRRGPGRGRSRPRGGSPGRASGSRQLRRRALRCRGDAAVPASHAPTRHGRSPPASVTLPCGGSPISPGTWWPVAATGRSSTNSAASNAST